MIVKNDVLSKGRFWQGIYKKHNKVYNGKPSWKRRSKAIWYVPKYDSWAIGHLKDIGTDLRKIAALDNTGRNSPHQVPNDKWAYWNREWKKLDIVINCNLGSYYTQYEFIRNPVKYYTVQFLIFSKISTSKSFLQS